ncbi:MAG TPA: outer membrane lipoprotein-sorting protein [Syntrophaceae bacterium]|nr:outer membrane lipoprotein-sorting protein [Syntrophaceae bacterium]
MKDFLKKWLFLILGMVFLCHLPPDAYGVEPGFPWSPPYTAEQIVYLCDAVSWTGGIEKAYKNYDLDALSIQVDARGYIRQNAALRKRKNYFDNYVQVLDYTDKKLKVGEPRNKDIVFVVYPPALRGMAVLDWKYKQSPKKYKAVDFWLYLPSLKNVRRLATGDRADGFAGGDMTYDDIFSLEPFDETHTLIGEDILPPGAVCPSEPRECYVIKSINKDPNYYLSKRLRWIDKETFIPWREEQYDRKGYLWVVFEKKMEKIQGYTVHTLWNYWNVQRDFRQPVYIFNYKFDQPMSDAEFTHDYLRKEFAWRSPSLKEFPFIKTPDELPPRPPLLRGKFKPEIEKERKIKLPEELEKELREGRLK